MKKALLTRIGVAVLTFLLCVPCMAPASASGYDAVKDKDCSLTIEYAPDDTPVEGLTFRIWRVASISETGYTPFEEFWDYGVLVGGGSWLDKAGTLYAYLQRDADIHPATAETRTDADGKAVFTGLEQGLYLAVGEEHTMNGNIYRPVPFLICLPFTRDLQVWEKDVSTHSKFTSTPITPTPSTVRRHVLKVWDDEGHEDGRPDEIVVDLLRNGAVYDTAVLTAENNWRWDWTGLDAASDWKVAERENARYTVLATQEGITFMLTNTWRDLPDDPEPGTDIPDETPPLGEPDLPDDLPPEEQIWDPNTPTGDQPDLPDDPIGGDTPGEDIPNGNTPTGTKLPQTGLLWWPVPLMAMGGVVLLAVGAVRRRRWNEEHED